MTKARGSADPGARPGWRWDVALSFAGAQRDYVGQVAQALKARGVRCFYDADELVRLWGTHLAEELPRIYARESALVVVFVSAASAAGDWTQLEQRAAFSRAVADAGVSVLPARFDDSELPGLLPDVVCVDLRRYTPGQFADLVRARLALVDAPSPRTDEGSQDYDTLVKQVLEDEKKKLRAAEARREQIRELLDLARTLAAKTAAVTQPDVTLSILRTEESPPWRIWRWFRGIYAGKFRGWAVFGWSGQSRTSVGGSAIHCSVLLTTTGDLVAFTHDHYEPRIAVVRDSKDTFNKISDIGDGRLLPRIFADDVTVQAIKEGMAGFEARRLRA